ncbi:MAG: 2-hydroxyglutaryl-CoA dehydratase [Candidatus Omnitrophica bacterium]|nr:2-hydroxyglutaryl-CoA dehydratase [Candidatus Omnitrophota bacterium]
MKYFLGIDIGSVSVKMAVLDEDKNVRASVYLDTSGAPIKAMKQALEEIRKASESHGFQIGGVGVTGSGRKIASFLIGADVIKNEVTAQIIAALHYNPEVSSIIEIGGQDSKVILLKNGIPVWFNLNTLCASGTGSFLASQAGRLKIPVEEFGAYASRSTLKMNIAAKCTVFSESDMIHKAALGCKKEDIINGLCEGLVRNFINNVTKNRSLGDPILFVGGVASNQGVVNAFERELGRKVIVPKEHKITGCIGAAILALQEDIKETKFKGFEVAKHDIRTVFFICGDCQNRCDITTISANDTTVGYLGSRCEKYNERQKILLGIAG